MSQKASVKRLWWKVDLLWGLFMRNTARRLPSIPTLQMTGVKMSLSQRLTNSSLAESRHRQASVWFMLQSLYTTESICPVQVSVCAQEYTPKPWLSAGAGSLSGPEVADRLRTGEWRNWKVTFRQMWNVSINELYITVYGGNTIELFPVNIYIIFTGFPNMLVLVSNHICRWHNMYSDHWYLGDKYDSILGHLFQIHIHIQVPKCRAALVNKAGRVISFYNDDWQICSV